MTANNFLNDKIDFQYMRPMFSDDYSRALGLLKKIDETKDPTRRELMETTFSTLVAKLKQ